MEVKKIVEGMTASQVAEVIDSNFRNQNKILEEDIKKQNNAIGVSEYKAFSEAESVAVGAVRLYDGVLYECVEATTGAFDASKWEATSFKKETEVKLSELASEVIVPASEGYVSLEKAISYVSEEIRKIGLKVTFNSAAGVWETWQYRWNDLTGWNILSCWIKMISDEAGNITDIPVSRKGVRNTATALILLQDGNFLDPVSNVEALNEITPASKFDARFVRDIGMYYVYDGSRWLNSGSYNKPSVRTEIGKYISDDGYLNASNGYVYSDSVRKTSAFLPIEKGDVIQYKSVVSYSSIANVCLYDRYKKHILSIQLENELITIDTKLDEYKDAVYFKFCFDKRYLSDLFLSYNFSNIYINEELAYEANPHINKYENNLLNQVSSDNFIGNPPNYSNDNASYTITSRVTNGVIHLAFRFKVNEDVNVTDGTDKTFLSFKSPTGSLDFYLHEQKTSQFEGGEEDAFTDAGANTRCPIPYYNSRFGVKNNAGLSNLNTLLHERGYRYDRKDDYPYNPTSKPLSGKDMFSIKIEALDDNGDVITKSSIYTDVKAQSVYEDWADAYIEVTDTSIDFVNESIGVNYSWLFTDHPTVHNMFEYIYRELNGKTIGSAKIVMSDINCGITGLYLCKNLLKHRYYLGAQYCSSWTPRLLYYDCYPAYIAMGIDESWHTFELITTTNKDRLMFCIDGQYQNLKFYDPKDNIVGDIKVWMNTVSNIVIGEELPITVRDLVYEYNEYSGVHASRFAGTYENVYFSSKMHPLVRHIFGHDLFESSYKGGPYDMYTKSESNGGFIPESIISDDVKGDGTHPRDRVDAGLYQPSWLFESGIDVAVKAGFKPITHKQYVEAVKTGSYPYERCLVIGFDDMPTYIYADKKLRSIFTKYGIKPYFAIELGWYVDNNAPTKSYVAKDWIESNGDTNERRLLLQRRLQALQNDGWGIELHGAKEGYVFRGQSYNSSMNNINEAIELAMYLGIESSAWCIAGNFFTPNALKLLEHSGMEVATSTAISPTSLAFSDWCSPRGIMPTNNERQRLYFSYDL